MGDFKDTIHSLVKGKYAAIAKSESTGCGPSCCGQPSSFIHIMDMGKVLDYTEKDLAVAPGDANLGLGCGNPISRANLKEGETVLDLGSGAGFDAFLAAKQVGASGMVIGVDMTPDMVDKAISNAKDLQVDNVAFRLGQIEKLPLTDDSVDVAISNCVINLSPDKSCVFGEIFRVLKPGGRLIISDVLRSGEIPEVLKNDPAAYTGWVSGAISPDEVKQILSDIGFEQIVIEQKEKSSQIIRSWNIGAGVEKIVFSAYIMGKKP